MNLFREHHVLDIKYYMLNFDFKLLILIAIFMLTARNNFMFRVKINCYRLHYLFMNNDTKLNFLKPYYNQFFNKSFNSFIYHIYPIMYYINIIITTICYNLILFDLVTNNFILGTSLVVLPFYSFFKLFYNLIYYFEFKYHSLFEYFVRRYNYMLYKKNENIVNDIVYNIPSDVESLVLKYEREL